MRYEFRKEMHELQDTLTAQARGAATAMRRSAASLRDANLALAESVIDADAQIDLLERTVDDMGISLLARQAPVASDLRTVVSALRMASTLERMGDLARHVAYIARGRFPLAAADGAAYELLTNMADQAAAVGTKMAKLVETQDMNLATQIEEEDEILDNFHRRSFELVLDDTNNLSRQEIVDVVLIGRFLERYGDHAVSVARRMTFLVTGIVPPHEFVPGTEEQMLGGAPLAHE
ncbi:MAG: phosphate signaling complex protein PhoU [Ancrocorticia sp.]|jgi:phosphate transport system protein|nr:phosphate signaling complex protein PhoU [Ancrocorticia sp.]MCI2178128.1 phosphate signaling complex protein PhoU [Ancrocorticia sp.]MCI2193935.1 phosphate signaling complex protein PhoU [Ancrocorticia sp.]MCI2198586.1 phosphate signaling complex protein PhoU [Ancrocorticia sp.]